MELGNDSNAWIRIAEVQNQQLNTQFIRLLSLNVIFCSSNGVKMTQKKVDDVLLTGWINLHVVV
jgi:hypothetical protein